MKAGLLSACMLAGLMIPVQASWAGDFSSLLDKADKGDQQAMLEAGVMLVDGREKSTAAGQAERLLKPLADEGEAKAMVWLGRAYRDGLGGVEKSPKKAFSYFERAAGRLGGDAEGQLELGRAYLNGTGTDRNLIAAYLWTSLSRQNPDSPEAIVGEAREQEQKLAGMLNDVQLEKARQLVGQIKTIYLK